MYPGDWTKGVQSVYILTVFYAPDIFLKNAALPARSTHRSGLKECSQFMYRLYSLSQSEAGITISIWGIKNTLSYPSKICYSLWYFSYLLLLQKKEQNKWTLPVDWFEFYPWLTIRGQPTTIHYFQNIQLHRYRREWYEHYSWKRQFPSSFGTVTPFKTDICHICR